MKRNFTAAATIIAFSLLFFGCQHAAAPQTAATPTPEASPSQQVAEFAPTPEVAPAPELEPAMLPGPNAVPKDTRVVVNIPAFRMDVFQEGTLIKSYRVVIGYPQFPVERGIRKAESIVFNPTWTPPHSSWVTSMGVTPGESIGAGSSHNPLGPIKIPIGTPTLIHGGKPLSKIGTFGSHGCVGLTNEQVRDFAQALVEASHTDLTGETMTAYLGKRTRTRLVKLNNLVPVELRYETIVVEGGQLHIYRDVYNQNTNTEANLEIVLKANGVEWNELTNDERTQAMESVDAMSRHPKKTTKGNAASVTPAASPIFGPSSDVTKPATATIKKPVAANQKEIVVDVAALRGRGYPVPVNLNVGAGAVGPQ